MSNSDEMRYAVSANVYPATFVTVRPCPEGGINGRSNFKIWEEQMLCLLDSQDMAGFVDGEIEPPIKEESEQLYKEWRRRDRLVKGWILGSIGKDALDAVWDQPTARSTWLELHRFFNIGDSEHEHKNELLRNENESKNEHENENEHANENELENENGHENELENENEHANENGNENEHEHENENEIEHEHEHENESRDFEHEHDNSNGALRFQSEHDNDSSAAAAGDGDYIKLYKAAQTGDWDTAEKIFKNKPELTKAKITSDSETALHVAVLSGSASIGFVRDLVKLMPNEELSITDSFGKTALHNAAIVGNLRAAHALHKRNPKLMYVWSDGNNQRLPVLEAAINCQKLTLQYLIRKHEKDSHSSVFEGMLGIQLLNEIIASQFVDVALYLVYKYPHLTLLTNEEDGTSALSKLIAATYTLFRRTESSLQRFVYHYIALDLVYKYPNTLLTNEEDGTSALSSLIASTYTLFRRTKSLLQRFVYHCIPVHRLQFEARPVASVCGNCAAVDIENLCGNCAAVDIKNLCGNWPTVIYYTTVTGNKIYSVWKKLRDWNVVEFLVPRGLKKLKQKKANHQQALQLAQYLCEQIVSQLPEKEALEIFKKSILVAAKYGVREIAEMIIDKKPSVIYHTDPRTGMNIFHLAASLRHENFFNLIYSMSDRKYMFFDSVDKYGNNLMHICGKLAPPESLDLVTGPALQMQREIQWFKEMEKFVNPSRRTRANMDGLTPQMLFSKEHKELKAEGEAWMKKTSNLCTVAATLIATVMFASAFTVPGGLESTTGVPLFAGQTAFSIFAIADTISLFTSISSVLAFLSIAASRCEEDFLYLAKTLSMGMFTLFISILFMLLAFGVALYLVPYAKVTWFLWVLAAVAVLPVSQFVLVLFPLLINVVSSTYHGIFGKRSNRVLY